MNPERQKHSEIIHHLDQNTDRLMMKNLRNKEVYMTKNICVDG
jgi:hypothetical protein